MNLNLNLNLKENTNAASSDSREVVGADVKPYTTDEYMEVEEQLNTNQHPSSSAKSIAKNKDLGRVAESDEVYKKNKNGIQQHTQ